MKDLPANDPIEGMPMAPTHPVSDEQLTRYLLGALPAEETERLDERSIADDELADRLRHLEEDLVDAYAAGTLSGERLQRFESFYLASPRRRRKAAFAKALRQSIDPVRPANGTPRALRWAVAAAAVLTLAVSVLVVQNLSLRRELRDVERRAAGAGERAANAAQELDTERTAAAAAKQALAASRAPQPLAAIALVLLPQTRGVAPIPTIAIPSDAVALPVDLALERAGGASYTVALRDPATNLDVWRSPALAPRRVRESTVVPVSVPAGLLKTQHYALDLFEPRAGAEPEFVSSYAFEVVRR